MEAAFHEAVSYRDIPAPRRRFNTRIGLCHPAIERRHHRDLQTRPRQCPGQGRYHVGQTPGL